ncbi:helix-turn-helix domain-containing protein [Nocardia sp. NPDC052566]|uniref:helix-turn-helix domain-containing protein n=1 Tax=Nocardia sp. NPDC052566 TaxID=3364330 RepID=UPI0037CAEC02
MKHWVVDDPGDAVAMEFAVRAPHPRLADHVVIYVGQDFTHPNPIRRRVGALNTVTLAIDFEQSQRREMIGPVIGPWRRSGSPVTGPSDQPMMFEQSGREFGMNIELTPLGAYALFGLPLCALTNLSVDLADLLGAHGRRLTEQLAETPGWAARFDLLDDHLTTHLGRGPDLPPQVYGAWQRLIATSGNIAIGALADETGWTRQHLRRMFRQHIGLPPKTVARIARLHRTVRIMTLPGARLPQIAEESGYFDQSHLNHDFRALTGYSPTEFSALFDSGHRVFMGAGLAMTVNGAIDLERPTNTIAIERFTDRLQPTGA